MSNNNVAAVAIDTKDLVHMSPATAKAIMANCKVQIQLSPSTAMNMAESERLKMNRAYFEEGCLCIHTAKTLQLCPTNMPDIEAVAFYEQHCKCSRNYIQS